MVQTPSRTSVTVPPDVTVHTLVVLEVKLTDSPLEAEAIDATENESSPNVFVPPV
jgi:hypothetical protein